MRVRDNIPDEPSSRRRLSAWLQEKLFERRIVLVTGRLDDDLAAEAAAAVMTLDAIGDEPIELHLDSPDGTLESAFVLIDTFVMTSMNDRFKRLSPAFIVRTNTAPWRSRSTSRVPRRPLPVVHSPPPLWPQDHQDITSPLFSGPRQVSISSFDTQGAPGHQPDIPLDVQ
jgi:hypothetical protein